MRSFVEPVRHRWRELTDLGAAGFAFRTSWELQQRTGLMALLDRPPRVPAGLSLGPGSPFQAPFERPALGGAIGAEAQSRLLETALRALGGKVLAFSRLELDFGSPIDWHRDPLTGRRWPAELHWSKVLRTRPSPGDIKLVWEVARFPQAYQAARAARFFPDRAEQLGDALTAQVAGFMAANPYGRGPQWASGQETAFRLMAWTFASSAPGAAAGAGLRSRLPRALFEGATALERHIDYSRKAVYNNHLISEAVGLLLAGTMLRGAPQAGRWAALGLELLGEQADRQFYPDGGYIQLSHNYERVALQGYLFAAALLRSQGTPVPARWLGAMERALDFLHSQQNPEDGRLPNFGANDGALPCVLSTCDHADFRPLLQSLSVLTRGERLFPPGPWDEECAWWLGEKALEAPLNARRRESRSFGPTGFHALRGKQETSSSAFRCGSVRDRFSQVDMLTLDVWWRGHNVLVDPGTYLYNGPRAWHEHFFRTAAHNTVQVDRRDQMLHYRQFKCLYWTEAELLRFEDLGDRVIAEGEHRGYARHPGGCIHRRAVLFEKDDLWVVVDTVLGEGRHEARLHWLGGEFPVSYSATEARATLDTPAGAFTVTVLDEAGAPLPGDVVSGQESPPRGWLSRYYAEKVAVPSLAVVRSGEVPLTFVSILAAGAPAVEVLEGRWTVQAAGRRVSFTLAEGRFAELG